MEFGFSIWLETRDVLQSNGSQRKSKVFELNFYLDVDRSPTRFRELEPILCVVGSQGIDFSVAVRVARWQGEHDTLKDILRLCS